MHALLLVLSTFSCYQTNFESNMCKAFATNFNEEIQVFGEGNHSVKIVSSPSTNDTYPNSIICRYQDFVAIYIHAK